MLSRNLLFKKVDDVNRVITPKPIIAKGAKLTDLISGAAIGSGMQLMISGKLKDLLYKYNQTDLQYFPMTVIYKQIELKGYWITNPYHFKMEVINFKDSIIEVYGQGNIKIRDVQINDLEDFDMARKKIKLPHGLGIKTLVLKENIPYDFFVLSWVQGGVDYFVSERLKYEIEDAGCTGMVFTKPEERYP